MIERIKRLLGLDTTESKSAVEQLSEIQEHATDYQAFLEAFQAGDLERAAEHHEWSAEEIEAAFEETVDVGGE